MVTNRAETDEQKTEELNAPRSSIFKTANGENHEIKGDLFDNQILEIDIELNKFGSLGSEIRGETANQKEVGSNFPNGDKDGEKKKAFSEGASEIGACHVANLSENPPNISETYPPNVLGKNSSRASKGVKFNQNLD